MTNLRELIQNEEDKIESDRTKLELFYALKNTRQEKGGLSLLEISETIKEVFKEEELEMIINNLR